MIPAVIERGAGIDVGKKLIAVTLMYGAADQEAHSRTRMFGTTTGELEHLRHWLLTAQCTHVAMESTGSYWKPIFNVLEDSLEVVLANPQQVKQRKGHKTDKKDSWWLAHLLRHGMIRPSFIPPRGVRQLRDLTRRRKRMVGAATSERNRVEKILQEANVKLSSAISNIFGVSGQQMLEALLEGQQDPVKIAHLARRRAKQKIPEITAALQGNRFDDHHRQMIRLCLDHLRFLEQQIAALDEQIANTIRTQGWNRQWEMLQTLPGLSQVSAASLLAETGPDLKAFHSVKDFASWAGICPGNNRSAGKNRSSRTTKGNRWLRATLGECAWAAAQTKNCFLKEKFWRLKTKGMHAAAAITAISHTLLQLYYKVLTTNEPFQQKGLPPIDDRTRQRLIRHHIRRLGVLGVAVYYGAQTVSPSTSQNPTPTSSPQTKEIVLNN